MNIIIKILSQNMYNIKLINNCYYELINYKYDYVKLIITRPTFDNKFDQEITDHLLEKFKDCEITNVDLNIMCDVCGKESKERNDFIRCLCDKCKNYYDYCNNHENPEKCPLTCCSKID